MAGAEALAGAAADPLRAFAVRFDAAIDLAAQAVEVLEAELAAR